MHINIRDKMEHGEKVRAHSTTVNFFLEIRDDDFCSSMELISSHLLVVAYLVENCFKS